MAKDSGNTTKKPALPPLFRHILPDESRRKAVKKTPPKRSPSYPYWKLPGNA